jgi:putative ABC transport system permease protein
VKLEEVDAISPLANLDQILLDLRYAVRGLLACPAFTAVVLAVLALGIGTTTAIFSVVDAVVLRGLPFREAHRLVAVWSTRVSEGSRPLPLSLPDVVDYRRLQDVFEGLAATTGLAVTLHDRGQAEPLRGARVTADLFEILRVGPEVGRVFTAEHEVNGNHNVAVISHGLWRRRFGADPGIVGRRISLDRGDVEVLGVMPAGFVYPIGWSESQDIWVPFVAPDSEKPRSGRRSSYIFVVGRLKRDVTLEQANAQMEQITASLASEYPAWFSDQDVTFSRSERPSPAAIAFAPGCSCCSRRSAACCC